MATINIFFMMYLDCLIGVPCPSGFTLVPKEEASRGLLDRELESKRLSHQPAEQDPPKY